METKLLARLKADRPEVIVAALRRGPAPTLFDFGDVPPFLASGANPQLLNRLPERLRHYAAKAPAAEFQRLMAEYGGKAEGDVDIEIQMNEPRACADDGWQDYRQRLSNWAGCEVER